MDDAPPARDRSSRFGEALQRAYAEDGRALPGEITRLMLDLSREETIAPVARAADGSDPGDPAAGGVPAAVPPVASPVAARRPGRVAALMGWLRRK